MDFTKICRLCCAEKTGMRSILEDDVGFPLRETFSNILQIEVFSDDQLPQNVCGQCISTLVNLNQTIEVFRENDLRLRQQLFGDVAVKKEHLEMEIELLVEPILAEPDRASTSDQQSDSKLKQELQSYLMVDQLEDVGDPEDQDIFSGEDTDDDYKPQLADEQDSFEEELITKLPVRKRRVFVKKERKPRGEPRPPRQKGKRGRRKTTVTPENIPRMRDFICYICKSEPLGSQDALIAHLHTAHEKDVPYTCTLCVNETVIIETITSLNVHKKMHACPYKCPQCDRRFSCLRNVGEHVKREHVLSEDPAECPQCGKVCSSQAALRLHIYRHNERIACDICGKIYSSKTKLATHIERKHTTDVKKFECHICHKMLKTQDSVINHVRFMHSTAEPLQCPQCPKTYASKYSLQHHIRKHETNPNRRESKDWKQYYSFVDGEEGLSNSLRMKKCNICGAVVRQISIHLIKKHFPQEYPCTLCDVVFKDKKPLQVHLLEHSQGKFLICPICDREFKDRKALLTHLQTKKHRDHPMAQSLDWLEAKYPQTMPKRMKPTAPMLPQATENV